MAANRSPAPLVAANSTRPRSNIEEAAVEDYSGELRRKKRIKYLLYAVAFVIFQTGIIVLFTQTIMKIRTPRFRMVSATFDNFTVGTPSSPSFDLNMNAQLGVKNTNFGNFRYPSTTMYLYYRGSQVGEALIPKANVGWRTTRKFGVVVKLSSANLTSNSQVLADDINAGVLPITSQSDLRGKVRLTFIFKKKKSSKMNCTMDVFTATQQLSNISCK
ncbi:late embryogenesis abundant protein At1g64065-like [Coffea arabica]|uniref:Late embryogenesis abundant protein At1g64065-like n=1 Tax=Coffea arabica TaxID=13443 RepID=A0ABM4WNT3_COFAR